MTPSKQWLDLYHRARSVGLTHETALRILVDPSESEPVCICGHWFTDGVCKNCGRKERKPVDLRGCIPFLKHVTFRFKCEACGAEFGLDEVDTHECPKPDPYQRFRDAIREGKRVFHIDERATLIEHNFDTSYWVCRPASEYFIEGVDIPVQPTQEWLDTHPKIELTGECRTPRRGELYVCIDGEVHQSAWLNIAPNRRFWIVRRKQPDPRKNFDAWIDALESETLKHALNIDAAARRIVRAMWEAINA